MGTSTSTLSALLRPNVDPQLRDLLYRETDFLNLLRTAGRIEDNVGASPLQWNVVTAANTSTEVFVDGQAPPAAGNQSYSQTSLAAFYVRGVFGITGHVRDNMRKGGYYTDPGITEAQLAQSDVFKACEDQLVGSTQDRGIASIVDSTGTYANISQGTVSAWASQEDGSIGVLGVSNMATLLTEMTSASQSSVPRNANPTHWLMPSNQLQNYEATVGPNASVGSLWRMGPGTGFDAGVPGMAPVGSPITSLSYGGIPIARVRGITSTEIYLVDITDWSLLIHRDLQVDPITGNPEQDQYQVSFAVIPKVGKRNHHGKMTGVTA